MRHFGIFLIFLILIAGCKSKESEMKIIFLHRSTGLNIWLGNTNPYVYKITKKGDVQKYFNKYNRKNNTSYVISERSFPGNSPYGRKNYPFDYYNIWVKNAGNEPYMGVPTLEVLTKDYDIIIFKHCYSASRITENSGNPDIDSRSRILENYKLQYKALKEKLHGFPQTNFILWTPAVHVKNAISEEEAKRTRDFYKWIINEWDEDGDNIHIWDFYKYQTEGGLYFKDEYATNENDSHPGKKFSSRIAPIFSDYVIDLVIRVGN